jgi:hypothetical protein
MNLTEGEFIADIEEIDGGRALVREDRVVIIAVFFVSG